jgi:hypothetical protein
LWFRYGGLVHIHFGTRPRLCKSLSFARAEGARVTDLRVPLGTAIQANINF